MSYMEFQKSLLREFRVNGYICSLKDERLLINRSNVTWEVDLHRLFMSKVEVNSLDVEKMFKQISETLEENLSLFNGKVKLDNVYPVIRQKDFDQKDELISFDLFLDLKIFLVEDLGNHLRLVRKCDVSGVDNLKELAFKNLETIDAQLIDLGDSEAFYTVPEDGIACCRFLTSNVMKQIREVYCENFLIIIPDDSGFIVTSDDARGYALLKNLVNETDYEYRISKKIYRYNNGVYSYADRKENFKLLQ